MHHTKTPLEHIPLALHSSLIGRHDRCSTLFISVFICGLTLLLVNGCYFPELVLSEAQKLKIKAHLLQEAPAPQHPINAVIGDQVRLIGVDIDRKTVRPGGKVRVTYYIEGLAEHPKENKLFVHFQGKRRGAWQNLDHIPIGGLFPLRQLKKGQILKDVQTFRVKRDYPRGIAKLYWGLYRGKKRLPIQNKKDVKHDKKNRVIIGQLNIGGQPYTAKMNAEFLPANETLMLDGKLDEPAWSRAKWTKWWGPPRGGRAKKTTPKTRAKFLWTPEAIYIGVECQDKDIWSTFTQRDSNTWEQEVVEIFLDPDGDQRDYIELQVTPANVIFDARFDYRRSDLKKARAWNMKGLLTAVHLNGTLNQRDDRDQSYYVEVKIPAAEAPGASLPLKQGAQWRVNLFRFNKDQGERQYAAALSPPIISDFHALEAFGFLTLSAPPATPPPATPPPATLPPATPPPATSPSVDP